MTGNDFKDKIQRAADISGTVYELNCRLNNLYRKLEDCQLERLLTKELEMINTRIDRITAAIKRRSRNKAKRRRQGREV